MNVNEYRWYWVRRNSENKMTAALVEEAFSDEELIAELQEMANGGPIERVYETCVTIGTELKNAQN